MPSDMLDVTRELLDFARQLHGHNPPVLKCTQCIRLNQIDHLVEDTGLMLELVRVKFDPTLEPGVVQLSMSNGSVTRIVGAKDAP